MSARVALCIDEAACRNPGVIGLSGESIDATAWLEVYAEGDAARRAIGADKSIGEAWVVSSEDVEPINLAAALKADRPDLRVMLVSSEGGGSLFSRAHTAGIDEVVDLAGFLRCYSEAKARCAEGASADKAGAVFARSAIGNGLLAPVSESYSAESQPVKLSAPLAAPSPKAMRAFLMPVVSGSGGAGKSSVAVMGAFIARTLGYRTLLLDYDLQFGDAAVMAGVEGALPIDEAMAHPDKLEREIRRDPGLAVLAAPERLEAAEDVVRLMPQFLDGVSGSFDVIIANTGAAWAEQHAVLLERCSAALFLVDQRASSVRACRHALELCSRCGIASGPFRFAVNRCSKNAPLTSVDVSSALNGAPVYELKDGGRDIEDYLGGGAASELLESRNEFRTSLELVLIRLLPGDSQRAGDAAEQVDDRLIPKRRARHAGRKRGWKA